MILGTGDIASVLEPFDRSGRLFFASGVSNSQEDRESEYQREHDLLMAQGRDRHLIYFSSLAIFYSNGRYARHKQGMEVAIRSRFPNYTIVRLGNITPSKNPNTLINFFKGQLERGEEPVVQDAYRYVVTHEEFQHWMGLIPDFNCDMNVVGERLLVAEILDRIKLGKL